MALLVNGQRIEESVLDVEFGAIKSYHENQGNVSCCERDPEFRQTAQANIVGRVVLAQEAQRTMPPTPDAELDAAVDKLKEEYGGESWFYSRTGVTPETVHLVRRDIDLDHRVRRMLEKMSDAQGKPTEQDLRDHYQKHLAHFMTAEEVQASHIIKSPRGDERDAGYELLRDLRRQLRAGADFDELARLHSDRGSDLIDLGWFKKGEIAPEFESVAFSMELQEISPIFVSQYGFHLIKLTGRKPSVPRPFDEVRTEVEQHLLALRRQEIATTLVKDLEAKARIEQVEDPDPAEAMM